MSPRVFFFRSHWLLRACTQHAHTSIHAPRLPTTHKHTLAAHAHTPPQLVHNVVAHVHTGRFRMHVLSLSLSDLEVSTSLTLMSSRHPLSLLRSSMLCILGDERSNGVGRDCRSVQFNCIPSSRPAAHRRPPRAWSAHRGPTRFPTHVLSSQASAHNTQMRASQAIPLMRAVRCGLLNRGKSGCPHCRQSRPRNFAMSIPRGSASDHTPASATAPAAA